MHDFGQANWRNANSTQKEPSSNLDSIQGLSYFEAAVLITKLQCPVNIKT